MGFGSWERVCPQSLCPFWSLGTSGSTWAANLEFSSSDSVSNPVRSPHWCSQHLFFFRGMISVLSVFRPCPAVSAPASCSPAAQPLTRPPSEKRWRCTTSSSLTSTPSKVRGALSVVLYRVLPKLGCSGFWCSPTFGGHCDRCPGAAGGGRRRGKGETSESAVSVEY